MKSLHVGQPVLSINATKNLKGGHGTRGGSWRFCEAIVRRDAKVLDNIVGADYTLHIADIPEGSLPRRMWMANTLNGLVRESCEVRNVAARRLAGDLSVVSSVLQTKGTMEGRDFSGNFYVVDFWKKSGHRWRMIARYSSPAGKMYDRSQ